MDKYKLFIQKTINNIINNYIIDIDKFQYYGNKLQDYLKYNYNQKIINYTLIIKEYNILIKKSNNNIEINMFKTIINEYNDKIKNIYFLINIEKKYVFDLNYIYNLKKKINIKIN